MKKLYAKSEIWFSIVFIAIYIIGASLCDMLSDLIGISKIITFPFLFALALFLLLWIKHNNLNKKYGLCKPKFSSKYFLYYIPLLILISTNLWFGVKQNYSLVESVFNILAMLCVGFVEEIIFRGFLFKMMAKDNVKKAIIVSAITFGIGHIVNLLNGAELVPTLMQVCYAISIGYLFVTIFYKSKSLIPCIITHCLVNSLSIFNVDNFISLYIASIFLIIVPFIYAIYINKNIKD